MPLTRRDLVFAGVISLFAWLIAASFLPSLRFVPQAILFGALLGLSLGLYVILTSIRSAGRDSDVSFPPTTSLSVSDAHHWQAEKNTFVQNTRYRKPHTESLDPKLLKSLDRLIDLVLRDFIRAWYNKVSSGSSFPDSVERLLVIVFDTTAKCLEYTDLVQICVTRILPIIRNHVKSYVEAETAVRGKNFVKNITETEEVHIAIAAKFRDGKVHTAASMASSKSNVSQQKHLRRLVSRILPKVLPATSQTSPAVNVLIRELVSCAVILPVLLLLADPDFISQQIENYGRSVIQERRSVKKLRAALDEQTLNPKKGLGIKKLPRLSPSDSERTFEKFIRAIRQTSSLPDARRLRSEVARQLRRDGQDHQSESTYLKRLEMGKKLLDQKVVQLADPNAVNDGARSSQSTNKQEITLREILYDATGLSYFMEYMDRLNLLTFVQFWIVVDGLRNPLDSETDTWSESERQDLMSLSNSYLARSELKVPEESQAIVKAFIRAGSKATTEHYRAAREVVDDVQERIFTEMKDKHLPNFKRSDLFLKWTATDAASLSPLPERRSADLDPTPASRSASPALSDFPRERDGHPSRPPILRRGIGSSSNVVTATEVRGRLASPVVGGTESRTSFDGKERRSLFEDDYDSDPLANSVQSLRSDTNIRPNEHQVVAAVQNALDDIIVNKDAPESFFAEESVSQTLEPSQAARDIRRQDSSTPDLNRDKPSLSSLGLLGTPHKRTVFSEGDLFGEAETLWEDENKRKQADNSDEETDDQIHEAAPGDLGLAEIIQALSLDIDKLEAQQKIVDSLTSKAELTNNTAELRILRKSRTSLDREIQRKQLQKQQYIVQESENNLYGKATILIKSVMVGKEADGHEYAVYVIEVQRPATEKSSATSWAIGRRYSEFHQLYKALSRRFRYVRGLDFPRRQTLLTLQKDFLKKRRTSLERFLQQLLQYYAVCRSLEFRAFLSQQAIHPLHHDQNSQVDRQDLITRIYNSVTDGMEDFLGNASVLDQLSLAGQNIISSATAVATFPTSPTSQAPPVLSMPTSSFADDPATAAEAETEINALDTTTTPTSPAEREATTFIKPVADAFIELFQLHTATGNAWLRGRTIVIILQQLLGGTVERKIRESFRAFTTPDALARYVDSISQSMWPAGKLREAGTARTARDKEKSRREAGAVLCTLLEEMAGGVVGRGSASEAGKRIARCLSNERLNLSLVFEILDELVESVFEV